MLNHFLSSLNFSTKSSVSNVIPAKAGIQIAETPFLDSRLKHSGMTKRVMEPPLLSLIPVLHF